MSKWEQGIVTNTGLGILAKAQEGKRLIITRIGLGDGRLGSAQAATMTALANQVSTVPITEALTTGGGIVDIRASIRPQDVPADFYWREVGVFARLEDGQEGLYLYSTAGDNASLIAKDSMEVMSLLIPVYIGNAQSVTAVLDESVAFVTIPTLAPRVTDIMEGALKPSATIDWNRQGAEITAAVKSGTVDADKVDGKHASDLATAAQGAKADAALPSASYTPADIAEKLKSVKDQAIANIGALSASQYTAADVLAKVKTVDGAGSGLDADLLQNHPPSYFLAASQYNSTTTLAQLASVRSNALRELKALNLGLGITAIPAGANLNDYRAPGVYVTNTASQTINAPVDISFRLIVQNTIDAEPYFQQIVITHLGDIYTRCLSYDSWTPWVRTITTGNPKLIWAGAANEGATINVPDIGKYQTFRVAVAAYGEQSFLVVRDGGYFGGIGGFAPIGDTRLINFGLFGSLNGTNLWIRSLRRLDHLSGGSHGDASAHTLQTIVGII